MTSKLKAYTNRIKYRTKVYGRMAKFMLLPKKQQQIVDQFHHLLYDANILGKGYNDAKFAGTKVQKNPFDLFIYQEIVTEIKPDLIIETGTAFGGATLFLASVCDLINKGKIVTIDVDDIKGKPKHKRITYLTGSSTDGRILKEVKKKIGKRNKVLVILDSDHTAKHVLKELSIYHKLVTKGSYLIVEDTNVNGNPVYPDHGPGPGDALKEFLKKNKSFMVDRTREKFYLTFNPGGYLKKIK